jgi:hypothetical protein
MYITRIHYINHGFRSLRRSQLKLITDLAKLILPIPIVLAVLYMYINRIHYIKHGFSSTSRSMDVSINGRLDGLSLQLTSLKDEVKQLRSDLASFTILSLFYQFQLCHVKLFLNILQHSS